MTLFRYFCKEIFSALVGLTIIILLIFLSNQFVQYLSRAASGQLPGLVVLQLMALEIPNLLSLLLPLGIYIAILIAYSRLYADNEMLVLTASGFSYKKLIQYTMSIALFVAVFVTILVFFVNPIIYHGRAKLIRNQGVATIIKTILPEQFRAINGGKQVFYVGEMSDQNTHAKDIFLAEQLWVNKQPEWRIMWSDRGQVIESPSDQGLHLQLVNGHAYEHKEGSNAFNIYHFKKMDAPIPTPEISVSDDVRTLSFKDLLPLKNKDQKLVAELQWRISIPIMVIVLAILALPLSNVKSRQGKYAKLLPAIILYMLYANFMFVGRDWLIKGLLPWWLGFWWLHGLMLVIAFSLMAFNRR